MKGADVNAREIDTLDTPLHIVAQRWYDTNEVQYLQLLVVMNCF